MTVFGLFEGRATIESPSVPLTSTTLLDMLGGAPGDAGVAVNEYTSMNMSAVLRCVTLISSVSAALPLHTYVDGTKNRAPSKLLADPHPDLTAYELWKLTYVHRCLWGNAYLQKVRDRGGQVVELWPIRPDRVRVGRAKRSQANPSGKMFEVTDDDGHKHPKTPYEILHLPGLSYDGLQGCSLVRHAAQGIGLALAAETFAAKLFGSGNLLSGLLRTEQKISQADADRLHSQWQKMVGGMGRAHDIAVLDSGATFQSLTMPTSDSQLLESRHFQITEASRYWGVPPFLMFQTEKSSSWGTGLEQQAQGWVTFDLGPQWLTPTEQRITKELLPAGEQYAKYKLEGLLRGDSKSRAAFYNILRNIGALSANEIRDLEDMTPVDGLDTYLVPMNMTTADQLQQGVDAPDEGTDDAA